MPVVMVKKKTPHGMRSSDSPLARYLLKHDLTQDALRVRVEMVAGWKIAQETMSRWSRGRVRPAAAARVAIERATGGEVRADRW